VEAAAHDAGCGGGSVLHAADTNRATIAAEWKAVGLLYIAGSQRTGIRAGGEHGWHHTQVVAHRHLQ
jgi:hypothetical protein